MKKRLLNLLIKYTKGSVNINNGKISLEWTWQENSLRWDLPVQDATPITLRDANMQKMGVYYPLSPTVLNLKNQGQQEYSRK